MVVVVVMMMAEDGTVESTEGRRGRWRLLANGGAAGPPLWKWSVEVPPTVPRRLTMDDGCMGWKLDLKPGRVAGGQGGPSRPQHHRRQ